jgi:P27 family predicted phage terminase small subunit
MGRRGPPPTPTSILELRGSWRAKGRGQEVQPALGLPRCPAWLRPEAKKKWQDIARKCTWLTEVDGDIVTLFCVAWEHWLEAERHLRTPEGEPALVETTEKGVCVPNPYLAIANKAMDQLQRLGSLLGLSPSARVGLHVPTPPPADPLGSFARDRQRLLGNPPATEGSPADSKDNSAGATDNPAS